MGLVITERDLDLISGLRKAGVLEDTTRHKLSQEEGVILISCSDGDQFPDIFKHQCLLQDCTHQPRIHTICLAGGALRLIANATNQSTPEMHQYMLEDQKFLKSDYTIAYIDQLISEGCQFSQS